MAKKKVVHRKRVRVAPDREEEHEVEVEVEVDDRPSAIEQHAQNEKEALVCPDCVRMAPRHCARHRVNLPI
jgi:hypothetical protein